MKDNPHKICQNCETPLNGLYCGKCGQKDFDDELKVSSIFLEWVDEHFGVNGTLWRTLKKLIASPSYLPKRYIEGHRVGYIRPIRLLLTLTVVSVFLNQFLAINAAVPTGKFEPDTHLPEIASGFYAFGECETKLNKVKDDFEVNYKSEYINFLKVEKGFTDEVIQKRIQRYSKISSAMCSYYEKIDQYRIYSYWIFLPLLTFFFWLAFRKSHQLKFMHILFYVLHYSSLIMIISIVMSLVGVVIFYFIGPHNTLGLIFGLLMSFMSFSAFILVSKNTFEIKGFGSTIKLLFVYFVYYIIYTTFIFSIGMGGSVIL